MFCGFSLPSVTWAKIARFGRAINRRTIKNLLRIFFSRRDFNLVLLEHHSNVTWLGRALKHRIALNFLQLFSDCCLSCTTWVLQLRGWNDMILETITSPTREVCVKFSIYHCGIKIHAIIIEISDRAGVKEKCDKIFKMKFIYVGSLKTKIW